jgi:SAM-dependent methyltransferase
MSLAADVSRTYYSTTAARSHRSAEDHYEATAIALHRRVRHFLPADPNTPIIDLGCGCGELLYMLEHRGYSRTRGVDLCAEEVDEAKKFVRGELACADALAYLKAQPDGSAGFITALNLVEHLPKDLLPDFFRDVRRVLSPGGTLLVMVPNAISPFGASTRYWDITHQTAFTPPSLRQLAALTGMSARIDFRECGPVPHGVKSAARYLLWQVLRGGIASWFLIELGTTRGGIYTMDMLARFHRD